MINNIIIEYAGDTTILGLIKSGDESLYREQVNKIIVYGEDNNLVLNIEKKQRTNSGLQEERPPLQPDPG